MIEQTMDNGFRRRLEFTGAFDRRNSDPAKNYGIHGMEMRFVLIGPEGAMQFLVFTNLMLPHVREELFQKRNGTVERFDLSAPMGADIGYHARTAQYDGQEPMPGDCEYVGGPCYYDGSSLGAQEFMPEFLAGGDDVVWAMLEKRYARRFAVAAQGVTL